MSPRVTIEDCVAAGARRLAAAGVPEPRREARLILAHALGVDALAVTGYPERDVPDVSRYEFLIGRRAAREPLSYLTGRREFWSLDFEVTPATLDPRPDSETLVEAALAAVPDPDAAPTILDFGTGTGCLLLALLSERPRANGIGIDVDPAAVAVARRNATRFGLAMRAHFAVGDWGAALDGRFNLVIANPPYIPSAEIPGLEREVAEYEPRRALDGGQDGLDSYRRLARDIARLLAPDSGVAVLEFGVGQGDDVASLLVREGLVASRFARDLAGRRRCIVCRKR